MARRSALGCICLLAFSLVLTRDLMAEPAANADSALQVASAAEQRGDLTHAIQAYDAAIATLTASHGQYDNSLVAPLIGLARCQIAQRDYSHATNALEKAQYIMHRTSGVDTLRQLGVIDLMTKIHMNQGKPLDANRQQQFALFLSRHNYKSDSPDLLPAIYKLSRWYIDTAQFRQARQTLQHAVNLIRHHFGPNDPHMIEALMLEAQNARMARRCCSYRYLERARNIVLLHPKMPGDARARVYVSLGDAYLNDFKYKRARAAYEKAWHLLGAKNAGDAFSSPKIIATSHELNRIAHSYTTMCTVSADPFAALDAPDPTSVCGVGTRQLSYRDMLTIGQQAPQQFSVTRGEAPVRYIINDQAIVNRKVGAAQRVVGRPFRFLRAQLTYILPARYHDGDNLAKLKVHLDFTVQANGHVSDLRLLDKQVPNSFASLMRKVVLMSRFRPRMVDGKPVTTKHVRLVETFDS